MGKKKSKKELLKKIRSGIRLESKAPKIETPKSVYTRKKKHKRRLNEDSSFFPLAPKILKESLKIIPN